MEDGNKTFVNKQHLNEIFSTLVHQRVLSADENHGSATTYCDVKIKVIENSGCSFIYAHSVILSAASPYFASCLGHDPPTWELSPQKPQIIQIQIDDSGDQESKELCDRVVRDVIEYIYTGVFTVDIATAHIAMQIGRLLANCFATAVLTAGNYVLNCN